MLGGVVIGFYFSIGPDQDSGGFSDEQDIQNTLDLSPYWGLPLNAQKHGENRGLRLVRQIGKRCDG